MSSWYEQAKEKLSKECKEKGDVHVSKYQCEYPEWETEPPPCDNPNEQPPVECAECC